MPTHRQFIDRLNFLGPGLLTLLIGAGLSWRSETMGNSPWHLVTLAGSLGALACLGAWLLPPLPRRAPWAFVGVGALILLGQVWLSPWLFSLGWLLAVFGLATGARSMSSPSGVALLLLPFGLLLGLLAPASAAPALLALVLLAAPHEPAPSQLRATPSSGDLIALLLAGGAGLLWSLTWSAARPLDPTLAGLGIPLTIAMAAAALTMLAWRSPTVQPAWLAMASMACWILLLALPNRAAMWIDPLAGQQDPRLYLSLLAAAASAPAGLALGSALAPLGRQQGGLLPLGVGAALAGAALGTIAPTWVVLALGALAATAGLLLRGPLWGRLLSPALGVGLVLCWQLLQLAPLDLLRMNTGSLRTPQEPSQERSSWSSLEPDAWGWGVNGAFLLELREGEPVRMIQDGVRVSRSGRQADTRLLMPHLGAALSSQSQTALVLGDTWGELSAGLLAQEFNDIQLAVPQASATQAVAARAPGLRGIWLHPALKLRRGSAEEITRASAQADLILEVASTPWRDAIQGLPTRAGLRLREQKLSSGGVYLLSVPVIWMEESELRGLLQDFAEVFPQSRAFLPAKGADQLLLAGFADKRLVSWDRVVQASVLGGELLPTLGIQSPLDLVDHSLSALVPELLEGAQSPHRKQRAATLHRRPRMLLPIFLDTLDGPEWLALKTQPKVAAALLARVETNRSELSCLDSAAHGQIQDVVTHCRALATAPGGNRRLEPLIAPLLESALKALERGDLQGCKREVDQARLLSPTSANAASLGGRCKLASGDSRGAARDFESALELNPADQDAFLGLAQIAVVGGQDMEAERLLNEAARRNPKSWRPPYYLGMLMLGQGRLDDADQKLGSALSLAQDQSTLPLAALAHLAILTDQPQLGLTQARLASDRDPTARNLHLVGWAYYELGLPEAALPFLERAVLADEHYLPAHAEMGRIFAARGDYSMAVDSFDRVLALDPNNPPALMNRQRAIALQELQTGAPTSP